MEHTTARARRVPPSTMMLLWVAVAVALASATNVQAQVTIGPQVAWHGAVGRAGAGVWIGAPVGAGGFAFRADLLWFTPEPRETRTLRLDQSYMQVNADVTWSPLDARRVEPFLRAGLGIVRERSEGGIETGPDGVGQVRYPEGRSSEVVVNLGGGVRVPIGESLVGIAGGRFLVFDEGGLWSGPDFRTEFVVDVGLGFVL